jgi:hypothetical protein
MVYYFKKICILYGVNFILRLILKIVYRGRWMRCSYSGFNKNNIYCSCIRCWLGPELVWTPWRKNFCSLLRMEPRESSSKPIAIQTELKKLRGLSPQANYTYRSTAASQRIYCPLSADRGSHVNSVMDPHGRILGFLDRSRYFFFQVSPQLYSRG